MDESNFYIYQGKKIQISPVENIVVARYQDSVSDDYVKYTISLKPAANVLGVTKKSYPSYHIVVVTLPPAGKADDLMNQLLQDKNIQFISRAYRDQKTGILMFLTDEIIIQFKQDTNQNVISKVLLDNELEVIKPGLTHGQYLTRVNKVVGANTLDTANRIASLQEIEFAEPNFITEVQKDKDNNPVTPPLDGNDLLNQQWYLHNTGQCKGSEGEDVKAFEAWQISQGGSEKIVIAILDDGVDVSHPDLKDNIWINPNQNALDRRGYNFVDHTSDPSPVYFSSPYNESSHNDIHGTACAGVAAASGNSGGPLGIAYKCKILPVKVFGENGIVADLDFSEAIKYAGNYSDVMNCSFYTKVSNAATTAINEVVSSGRKGLGCIIIAASGNSPFYQDSIAYPAVLSSKSFPLIAVGASTNQGLRADYSHYGPELDFLAPSSGGTLGILTTDVSIPGYGYNNGKNGEPDKEGLYTNKFGGTSASAPLVAGIAALVLSIKPSLRSTQVRDILSESCDKIDPQNAKYDDTGFSITHGYGRINAKKALDLALLSQE